MTKGDENGTKGNERERSIELAIGTI